MKKIRETKLKGFTMVETMLVIVLMIIIVASGVSIYSSSINKAKVSLLLKDFASLKTASMNMLYEKSGLGTDIIDEDNFYVYFNHYVDSNCALEDDNTTLLKKDPWNVPYSVTFEQLSPSETTILFESKGKSNQTSYAMLVHYKNGEVRVGTAGFDVNEGEDTSDFKVEDGIASITDMWAK